MTPELRETVRQLYQLRCGYCSVDEVSVGNLLEIDHFRPITQGGSDELSNLVYACTACNRYKAYYWPSENSSEHMCLLHPLNDDVSLHVSSLSDGQLIGLTARGNFHIDWLRLNRPQLIAHRRRYLTIEQLKTAVQQSNRLNHQLEQKLLEQKHELRQLQARVRHLMK